MAISDKLNYLIETKSQLKDMINYGLDDDNKITSTTTFRNYVGSIFKAFLESLNNPSTLFNNLPKITGTGSNITLNDTANAPMRIMLNATEITQDGTPTPSSPQDIHTISGDNKLVVNGKNLFTIKNYSKSGWIITIDNPLKNMSVGSYTISCQNKYINAGSGKSVRIYFSNTIGGDQTTAIGSYFTDYTFGASSMSGTRSLTQEQLNANYMVLYPNDNAGTQEVLENMQIMIEKGSSASSYEPYVSQEADIDLDTLEYCKIGNYEDKFIRENDGTWKLEKNIGKYVANGDLTGNGTSDTTVSLITPALNISASLGGTALADISKNNLLSGYSSTGVNTLNGTTGTKCIRVVLSKDYCSDYATANTFLKDNNFTICYGMETPKYIPITGTLAEQLENVYQLLKSYKGVTNISQVNNDLAFELDVQAIEDME